VNEAAKFRYRSGGQ
jgi:2-oxoisovalerate dehydrogenase E1 component beta subunit